MRVLEVVVRFFPYVGGVENTVLHLGRGLAARGHAVRVVCAAEPAGAPERIDGIEVVRLPYRGKLGNTNLAFGLLAALRREPADVIHTHMPTAWFADAAGIVAAERGVPLVLSYNNDLVGRGAKGIVARVYNRAFLPKLLARADRIVTSNPVYAAHSPYLKTVGGKLLHIPWGVDAASFRPAPPPSGPEVVLGFLALLDPHHRYKGLEPLLRALAGRVRAGSRLRLRVGGAGEELPRYQKLAADLGIQDRVDFLGFVPHADLVAFFQACHLFALPSTDASQEGFGLVLLEAMACGRPVLTTPVVGMAADIAERGAGRLVPPGDIPALEAALVELESDPAALTAMGERARLLVEERYTWEKVTDAYEGLFRGLVGTP